MTAPYHLDGGATNGHWRSLQDTVVVVTGAGGGIGGATARLVLECGGRVVAGDVRAESLALLREEWGEDRLVTQVGETAAAGAFEKCQYSIAQNGRHLVAPAGAEAPEDSNQVRREECLLEF